MGIKKAIRGVAPKRACCISENLAERGMLLNSSKSFEADAARNVHKFDLRSKRDQEEGEGSVRLLFRFTKCLVGRRMIRRSC